MLFYHSPYIFTFSCEFDYVEIQEGRTGTGTVLGRYCGTDLPPTTKSTTNEVTLHFRSDISTAQEGFQAKYSIGKIVMLCFKICRLPTKVNYSKDWIINLFFFQQHVVVV